MRCFARQSTVDLIQRVGRLQGNCVRTAHEIFHYNSPPLYIVSVVIRNHTHTGTPIHISAVPPLLHFPGCFTSPYRSQIGPYPMFCCFATPTLDVAVETETQPFPTANTRPSCLISLFLFFRVEYFYGKVGVGVHAEIGRDLRQAVCNREGEDVRFAVTMKSHLASRVADSWAQ